MLDFKISGQNAWFYQFQTKCINEPFDNYSSWNVCVLSLFCRCTFSDVNNPIPAGNPLVDIGKFSPNTDLNAVFDGYFVLDTTVFNFFSLNNTNLEDTLEFIVRYDFCDGAADTCYQEVKILLTRVHRAITVYIQQNMSPMRSFRCPFAPPQTNKTHSSQVET